MHVLSTPPAFNLSQNQTLQLIDKNSLALSAVACEQTQSLCSRSLFTFQRTVPVSLSRSTGNPHCLANLTFAVKRFFSSNRNFFDPANKKAIPWYLALSYPKRHFVVKRFFCRTGIFCRFKTPISICQTVSANSFTAAARSGYAPFATPCQQLFYFFLPFLHTLFLTHFFPLLFFYTALYSRPLPPGTDRRRERVPPCCCVADAYCMPVRLCFLLTKGAAVSPQKQSCLQAIAGAICRPYRPGELPWFMPFVSRTGADAMTAAPCGEFLLPVTHFIVLT